MRKVIAAINITLDGYCDHTAGVVDAQLHEHYATLLRNGGVVLYGRITYELMEDYWPQLVQHPSGMADYDDFAKAIDGIPKIVFSRTRKSLNWDSAQLATESPEAVVRALREQEGRDIYLGSPSLILAMTELNLVDEFQLCIHPVILGRGLPLFRNLSELKPLQLTGTKVFASGVVLHTYRPHTAAPA